MSSLNRYAYCEGNPVSFLDSFGLWREDTKELHEIASTVNLVGIAVTFIGLPELGGMIILMATCFYMGLCLYDAIDDAVQGRGFFTVLKDLGLALANLACLLTAGTVKVAQADLAASEAHVLESVEKEWIAFEKYLRNDLKRAKKMDKVANYVNIIGNKIANFSFSDFKQKLKKKMNDGKEEFIKKSKWLWIYRESIRIYFQLNTYTGLGIVKWQKYMKLVSQQSESVCKEEGKY